MANPEFSPEDLHYAALTVAGEARGHPPADDLPVAWTIVNRARFVRWQRARSDKWRKQFGDGTLKGACLAPLQYSCWNANDPNRAYILGLKPGMPVYDKAMAVVLQAVAPGAVDPTNGANHYYTIAKPKTATTWPPKWTQEMRFCGTFGPHTFWQG